MNSLLMLLFVCGALANKDWQDTYEGAYYVTTTVIIFAAIFGVLIVLSFAFAITMFVRERFFKNKKQPAQEPAPAEPAQEAKSE